MFSTSSNMCRKLINSLVYKKGVKEIKKMQIQVTFDFEVNFQCHSPVFSIIGFRLNHMRFSWTFNEKICRTLWKICTASWRCHWIVHT
jgi:hypothetical protein